MNCRMLSCALACLFGIGVAWAEELPAHYPTRFHAVGDVDLLDYRSGNLVVGDTAYVMTNDTVVSTMQNDADTLFSVRTGKKVGLQFSRAGNARVVQQIWVLPDGYGASSE